MNYLEKIAPSYLDLLGPLRRWKILDIEALKKASEYQGSASGFYKIISKLEKVALIDSFINSWSNQKFVYLLPDGVKALGENGKGLYINRETRFHDSLVSRVAQYFSSCPFTKQLHLDFEIEEKFPLLERLPDILIEGQHNRPFKMAVEVELTAKSGDRVRQILKSYSDSVAVNNVLYITDKKSILTNYMKHLIELGESISAGKFLFIWEKDLAKKNFNLALSPLFHMQKQTSLKELFSLANG